MRLPSSTVAVALGVLAASVGGAEAAGPMRLAGHRAVYDLTLAESRGARPVESVRGRIVLDFSGDACQGYTLQTRQVMELDKNEADRRLTDTRNTTFESGDGHSFRFETNTVLNGSPSQAVDGTAESAADALKVRLKKPKRDRYTQSGPVLFPMQHMRRVIEAAQAGETTMSAKVFDGSDDGRKIFDTLAVIGRPITTIEPAKAAGDADRDKPLSSGEMASMLRWPVTLSYFTAGQGDRTPVYVLTFLLYENGVSGALSLNYGEFTIAGDLSRLDFAKVDAKAEAECKITASSPSRAISAVSILRKSMPRPRPSASRHVPRRIARVGHRRGSSRCFGDVPAPKASPRWIAPAPNFSRSRSRAASR